MSNSVFECCICNNYKKGEFIVINDKKYHLCCIEQLQDQLVKLEADKQGLNDLVNCLQKELREEKEMVSKAMKYCNDYCCYTGENGEMCETDFDIDELLDILGGTNE